MDNEVGKWNLFMKFAFVESNPFQVASFRIELTASVDDPCVNQA